jgi:hypothetical protein
MGLVVFGKLVSHKVFHRLGPHESISDPSSDRAQVAFATWATYRRSSEVTFEIRRTTSGAGDLLSDAMDKKQALYPVRLPDDECVPYAASDLFAASGALLSDGTGETDPYLIPIKCEGIPFCSCERDFIRIRSRAYGVYAMLPLEFEKEMKLLPRRNNALKDLNSLATDYLRGIAPLDIVLMYFGLAG